MKIAMKKKREKKWGQKRKWSVKSEKKLRQVKEKSCEKERKKCIKKKKKGIKKKRPKSE